MEGWWLDRLQGGRVDADGKAAAGGEGGGWMGQRVTACGGRRRRLTASVQIGRPDVSNTDLNILVIFGLKPFLRRPNFLVFFILSYNITYKSHHLNISYNQRVGII